MNVDTHQVNASGITYFGQHRFKYTFLHFLYAWNEVIRVHISTMAGERGRVSQVSNAEKEREKERERKGAPAKQSSLHETDTSSALSYAISAAHPEHRHHRRRQRRLSLNRSRMNVRRPISHARRVGACSCKRSSNRFSETRTTRGWTDRTRNETDLCQDSRKVRFPNNCIS